MRHSKAEKAKTHKRIVANRLKEVREHGLPGWESQNDEGRPVLPWAASTALKSRDALGPERSALR